MNKSDNINRRRFLQSSLIGSAALLGGSSLFLSARCDGREQKPASSDFAADIEIELTAASDEISILPGQKTQVWRYRARVLKGSGDVVQNLEDTFTGPVFRLQRGQKVRVYFKNEIPDKSIVHWHGLHVPEEADGHPRFVIKKGRTYIYEFEVKNRAATYWFHPHPHGRTGPQVYNGLAGLFLVTDEEERALDLPSGDYDVPIVIQDRTFDRDNQLVYLNNRMQRMTGFLGEQILVNGKPDAELSVATRAYRFRVLNGSNSRIYKLAWSDGTPLVAIGTDGGLLQAPVQKDYIILGPAERVDLWVDFSSRPLGSELTLKSLPFSGANTGGMMGGGMMGMGRNRGRDRNIPGNGDELTLLRVRVDRREQETRQLPQQLSQIDGFDLSDAVNRDNPRTFRFAMQGMKPTINGRTFQMTKVAEDEIVKLNTTEVWQLVNGGGGMGMMGGMMQMPHPVHVHGLQFQIIERTPSAGWDSIKDGFIDSGWKDTVLLMPNMRAKILLRFEDYTGLFLYHCHNLEHEDLGMMRNYSVKA
ncbi:MAG: multicopper oxidase domain-containing protein [Calditrichaeota bacterium]|nr:multicopper oxidase domain-containing protein [Calditrichota bacterium]